MHLPKYLRYLDHQGNKSKVWFNYIKAYDDEVTDATGEVFYNCFEFYYNPYKGVICVESSKRAGFFIKNHIDKGEVLVQEFNLAFLRFVLEGITYFEGSYKRHKPVGNFSGCVSYFFDRYLGVYILIYTPPDYPRVSEIVYSVKYNYATGFVEFTRKQEKPGFGKIGAINLLRLYNRYDVISKKEFQQQMVIAKRLFYQLCVGAGLKLGFLRSRQYVSIPFLILVQLTNYALVLLKWVREKKKLLGV